MAKAICGFCGEKRLMMWFCRHCRMHFCANCAGGGFTKFTCPKGHEDVVKVAG